MVAGVTAGVPRRSHADLSCASFPIDVLRLDEHPLHPAGGPAQHIVRIKHYSRLYDKFDGPTWLRRRGRVLSSTRRTSAADSEDSVMPVAKPQTRGLAIADAIRAGIIDGRWRPGDRLQPAQLAEHYETSTTVVREALTRLAGESVVAIEPNRGFFVPRLDLAELRDLTELRCRIEGLAVELAVVRGGLVWESELIATHHQLSRTPRRGPDDPQHVADAWAEVHRAFHAKLIEASGVPIILSSARRLGDATELYRRWAAPSEAAGSRDVEREHSDILEAVVRRDAVRASALLRRHYERTVDVVLRSGLVDGLSAPL